MKMQEKFRYNGNTCLTHLKFWEFCLIPNGKDNIEYLHLRRKGPTFLCTLLTKLMKSDV